MGWGGVEMEVGWIWEMEGWAMAAFEGSPGSGKMERVGMGRIGRKKLRNIFPASNDMHLPEWWVESNPSHDRDCFLDLPFSFLN